MMHYRSCAHDSLSVHHRGGKSKSGHAIVGQGLKTKCRPQPNPHSKSLPTPQATEPPVRGAAVEWAQVQERSQPSYTSGSTRKGPLFQGSVCRRSGCPFSTLCWQTTAMRSHASYTLHHRCRYKRGYVSPPTHRKKPSPAKPHSKSLPYPSTN